MKKHILAKSMALAFACYFNGAQASLLSVILPNGTGLDTTHKGMAFDAGIYLSNTSDFSGFDFEITFDSSKMTAVSLTNNNDLFGAGAVSVFANGLSSAGHYHFAELIDSTNANAVPASPVVGVATPGNPGLLLGTLHFTANNLATNSFINFAAHFNADGTQNPVLNLWDGTGAGANVQGASLNIGAPVPLPASAFLFAPALLAVFGLRKNKTLQLAA